MEHQYLHQGPKKHLNVGNMVAGPALRNAGHLLAVGQPCRLCAVCKNKTTKGCYKPSCPALLHDKCVREFHT
ncbi:hypothetical protein ANN_09643 [Periplaneta americana]|uniref:Uncharacterized protein n=1 Tax=Periplaneta americana TaxID=6978 RepID=A0ABQ8TNC6_PERAM|nr:hypothetical protein ANN_09643 [Periplaneta americana]